MLLRTVTLGLAGFFLIGSFNITQTAINSLVLNTFGPEGIPLADLFKAGTATLFCAIVLYQRKLRVKLSRVVIGLNSLAMVYLLIFPLLQHLLPGLRQTLVLALALNGSALITSGIYSVWMLFTTVVPGAKTKHFTLFSVFLQVAAVAAVYLIRYLLATHNISELLRYGASGYAVAYSLVGIAMLRYSGVGGRLADFAEIEDKAAQQPLRAIAGAFSRPYLRGLFLVIILDVAFGSMVAWRVFRLAAQEHAVEDVALLLNRYGEYVSWGALLSQLVAVPFFFHVLTPRYGLLVLPTAGMLVVTAVGLGVPAAAAIPIVATYTALDYTVNNCMRESLYMSLPLTVKVHFKSVFAFLAPRAGSVCGSLLLLAASRWGLWLWFAALVVVGTMWVLVAWRVLRFYGIYSAEGAKQVQVATIDEIGVTVSEEHPLPTTEKIG
ncbi:MAG TPA: hypothetical protein VHR66_18395 [Gemmataceae bacterium]|jgi:hypothetical protein|nr:hypothetical protein [Gemmataceae bacterium]